MDEILQKVKELEKQARQAEHYKEMYDALYGEIKTVISGLSNLSGIKPKREYKSGDVIIKLQQELYQKIVTDDTAEIKTRDIEQALSDAGYSVQSANQVNEIRQWLYNQPGVMVRQKGQQKIIYYFKPKDDKNKELIEAMPQKMSHMG